METLLEMKKEEMVEIDCTTEELKDWVGTCPKPDLLLSTTHNQNSYYPVQTTITSTIMHKQGPLLAKKYDGSFTWNTNTSLSTIHLPPTHQQSLTVYFQSTTTPNKYRQVKVVTQPLDEDTDNYVIKLLEPREFRGGTCSDLWPWSIWNIKRHQWSHPHAPPLDNQ